MKHLIKWSLLAVMISLLISSCKKEDEKTSNISTEKVKKALQINLANQQISTILKDAMDNRTTTHDKSVFSSYSDCVTITQHTDSLTTYVCLDFGEGCELPDGNIVSGIINFNFLYNFTAINFNINYSYDNFTTYNMTFNGDGNFVYNAFNEEGNSQMVLSFNSTVSGQEGEIITNNGQLTSEWSGFNNLNWLDNTVMVSGNWNTFFGEDTYEFTIVNNLQSTDCLYFDSGNVIVNLNGENANLDFGTGICDNNLSYSDSFGNSVTIEL